MVRLPLPLLALPLAAGAGAPAGPEAAVSALLTRLLPTHAADFEPSLLQPSACHGETRLCFGYSTGSAPGKVSLKGTSGVELAMAANHYLKYVANVSVSWENTGGNQALLAPGRPLPPPPKAGVHIERSTEYHYYANVCTFSYSFVWYSLEDWQREIDCQPPAPPLPGRVTTDSAGVAIGMALNGVNMPLAYTGQERIYQKLYNAFGISNDSLADYFGGPAFLAWNRGQGLLACAPQPPHPAPWSLTVLLSRTCRLIAARQTRQPHGQPTACLIS